MAQGYSLKDRLFNAEKVRHLADLFSAADPAFDAQRFQDQVMARLPELELKARIAWIAEALGDALPGSLPQIAPVLHKALPPPLDSGLSDGDFGDFIYAPLGDLAVARGLETDPELVLDLLEAFTQRFSMEWAVRPMLNRWPDLTLARMAKWTGHDSYHVRRLVSEGTRPRLPWGVGVTLDVTAGLPLLDRLHADPTRYVTRSVANHLNDIARTAPDLVIARLRGWRAAAKQQQGELDWMVRHALRGLVRDGHPQALKLLGYDPDAAVDVAIELAADRVPIGGILEFSCTLRATGRVPVLVDYVVHFLRPSGRVSPRVHKLKADVVQDGTLILNKRHRLKADATTYDLVPGIHLVQVQVNGRVRAAAEFELVG
jgi:3-methyladenine DNA glycosylase AlkC